MDEKDFPLFTKDVAKSRKLYYSRKYRVQFYKEGVLFERNISAQDYIHHVPERYLQQLKNLIFHKNNIRPYKAAVTTIRPLAC